MYLDPSFGGMLLQVGVVILAVGGAILHSLRRKIRKLTIADITRPATNVLAICLIVLFFVNMLPGAYHNLMLSTARTSISEMEENDKPYRIKTQFNVDASLSKPDIYWFHVDGMMSIEALEAFYDENMDWLRYELDSRGFVRYENAQIRAGYTMAALTAMLSPEFYDSFFGEILRQNEGNLREETDPEIETLARAGLSYNENIIPNYELYNAFISAGYTVTVYDMDTYMPRDFQASKWRFYNSFMTTHLPELLTLTTPLRFGDRHSQGQQVDMDRVDYLPRPENTHGIPNFIYYGLDGTHMDNVWEYDPALTELDATAFDAYLLAYIAVAEQTLKLIDKVREENPDAVIIIQADHGFHLFNTQHYLADNGYSNEEVTDLAYSVLSAVYIPAQYGGLHAPLNPLNITRELINRFVGENYEILK